MGKKRPQQSREVGASFAKNKRQHGGHGSRHNAPFKSMDEEYDINATSSATPADLMADGDSSGLISLKLAPEHSTEIYPDSQKQLAKHPNRKLGIDSCIVCGVSAKKSEVVDESENSRECTRCFRVEYCDKIHKKRDRKAHINVCDFLYQLNKDEEYMAKIGCEGDAFGFGDGTGIGGDQSAVVGDIDYCFDLIKHHQSQAVIEKASTRARDLCGMVWVAYYQLVRALQTKTNVIKENTQITTLPFPLGSMHRSWDWKALLLMPIGTVVNNHQLHDMVFPFKDTYEEKAIDAAATDLAENKAVLRLPSTGSVLQAPAVLRALTTYTSCPLTVAHNICSYAPLIGLAKAILAPHIVESHVSNDVDGQVIAPVVSLSSRKVFTVHVVGASTLEASVSRLPFWSLLPQALAQRCNLTLSEYVHLRDIISGDVIPPSENNTLHTQDWHVRVIFVGPELPNNLHSQDKALDNMFVSPHLSVGFYQGDYDDMMSYLDTLNPNYVPDAMHPALLAKLKPNLAKTQEYNSTLTGFCYEDSHVQLVAGFQMGLTVKDYNWGQTLGCMRGLCSTKRRRAWLQHIDMIHATEENQGDVEKTNTDIEAIKAKSYVNDARKLTTYVLTTSSTNEEAEKDAKILIAHCGFNNIFKCQKNPLTSLQVLQSGTLANDVWYKGRYASLFTSPNLF